MPPAATGACVLTERTVVKAYVTRDQNVTRLSDKQPNTLGRLVALIDVRLAEKHTLEFEVAGAPGRAFVRALHPGDTVVLQSWRSPYQVMRGASRRYDRRYDRVARDARPDDRDAALRRLRRHRDRRLRARPHAALPRQGLGAPLQIVDA